LTEKVSRTALVCLCAGIALLAGNRSLAAQISTHITTGPLGIFDGQSDVGSVDPAGTLTYDSARDMYTLTAAGENIWSTVDAFHFAWKKMSGDVSLTADITFPDNSGSPNPHRKAVLMFRQTLEADSVYADAAQHGVGLTALQYRRTKGDTTQDIELNIDPPKRVRLEKHGDVVTMFISLGGEPLHQVGASTKLPFEGPFYAGIGLCSHNAKVVEKAILSNVHLQSLETATAPANVTLYSSLKTIGIDNSARVATLVYSKAANIQAPNWSKDGSYLVFTEGGRIWKISAKGGVPEPLDIGSASRCNGSHGFSPDGKWLAISCATSDKPESRVYVVPAQGGTPRLVTENPNSYWHTWSPDGKTIVFTRPTKVEAATSSQSPPTVALKERSQRVPASATILIILPTANTFISTPTGAAVCRSGACAPMEAIVNRSPLTTTPTGHRTSHPTASPCSFSATTKARPVILRTRTLLSASCLSKIERRVSL